MGVPAALRPDPGCAHPAGQIDPTSPSPPQFFPGRDDLWAADGWIDLTTYAGQDWACLVVENSGDVLDPGLVSVLTEPFQRGSERIRGGTGHVGTGLGLAIVASIVKVHDGTLDLEPGEAGGLRVTAYLPALPT